MSSLQESNYEERLIDVEEDFSIGHQQQQSM